MDKVRSHPFDVSKENSRDELLAGSQLIVGDGGEIACFEATESTSFLSPFCMMQDGFYEWRRNPPDRKKVIDCWEKRRFLASISPLGT